jgi:hypothetical protein
VLSIHGISGHDKPYKNISKERYMKFADKRLTIAFDVDILLVLQQSLRFQIQFYW